ncbi:unnamed protein product [Bursaphelenchus okinawaensis]|uniref:39S ribosomal protein L41, mitochondrial n=1 Tax=Bursaphelenchus okinawaensis TaxID=465554 RepID=A0A811KAJ3_9BILA|nr:unnamed protein product [Bursaphelenchus okinawaensis]CAG9097538.1 unnamed protein product [Bursaphelenchus okinawaensis]
MVRSLHPHQFRSPWPMYYWAKGLRKIGPQRHDKNKWPVNRWFPELNPKIEKTNPKQLWNYTKTQPTGYVDPVSKEFVHVPEMVPELIVPDLTGFELKPYVSYKVDNEIEKREKAYHKLIKEKGSIEMADLYSDEDQRWPPPKTTPKLLFDIHYAEKIRAEFNAKNKKD